MRERGEETSLAAYSHFFCRKKKKTSTTTQRSLSVAPLFRRSLSLCFLLLHLSLLPDDRTNVLETSGVSVCTLKARIIQPDSCEKLSLLTTTTTTTTTTMPQSFDSAACSLALLGALKARNESDAAFSEIVRDYNALSTLALEAQVNWFGGGEEEEERENSMTLRFFFLPFSTSTLGPPTSKHHRHQQQTRTAQLEKEAHELRAESREASDLISTLRQEASLGSRAAEAERELLEARKEAADAYREKSRIAEEALETSRALAAARESNASQAKALEMAAEEVGQLRRRAAELDQVAEAAKAAAAASEEELRRRLTAKEEAISRSVALEAEVADLSRRLVELKSGEIERMNAVNEQCDAMLRAARSAARGAAAMAAAKGAATATAVGGAASGFLDRAFFGGRRSSGGGSGGGEAAAKGGAAALHLDDGDKTKTKNDDDDVDADDDFLPPPPPPSLLPDTLAACLPPHAGGAFAAAFDRSGKGVKEEFFLLLDLSNKKSKPEREKNPLFFFRFLFLHKNTTTTIREGARHGRSGPRRPPLGALVARRRNRCWRSKQPKQRRRRQQHELDFRSSSSCFFFRGLRRLPPRHARHRHLPRLHLRRARAAGRRGGQGPAALGGKRRGRRRRHFFFFFFLFDAGLGSGPPHPHGPRSESHLLRSLARRPSSRAFGRERPHCKALGPRARLLLAVAGGGLGLPLGVLLGGRGTGVHGAFRRGFEGVVSV